MVLISNLYNVIETRAKALVQPKGYFFALCLAEVKKSQETYLGRLKYFFVITNPLNAFIKEEKAQWAKKKMENYWAQEKLHGGMLLTKDELQELLKAERVYNSIYHPDTKEKIPYAFRTCAFMPTNLPIIFGMICTPQNMFTVVFWQWINQTYNAFLNYCNRNATTTFTNKELAIAYTGAVTTSIGIALLGRKISERYGTTTGSISSQRLRNGLVSLFALSSAGFLNLYLIRYNETKKGVMLTKNGKEYGYSKAAAQKAVVSSASTRAVLPIPMMLLTPMLWKMVEVARMAPKTTKGVAMADMLMLVLTLTVAMPISISLFKQELSIESKKVEPQYQNLKDAKGQLITEFTFNKGL